MAITPKLRYFVLSRDKWTCHSCGRKPPEVIIQCGHIISRAKGGSDHHLNLRAECRDCNLGHGEINGKDILKETVFYTNHKARKVVQVGKDGRPYVVYQKFEKDDHLLHKNTKSITIEAHTLESADWVQICIPHRNVEIWQSRKAIKAGKVLTHKKHGVKETKYHLPIEKWIVRSGDKNWAKRILEDLENERLVLG